jgi:hypothetical protein
MATLHKSKIRLSDVGIDCPIHSLYLRFGYPQINPGRTLPRSSYVTEHHTGHVEVKFHEL